MEAEVGVMEDMRQAKQVTFRRWKKQGNEYSPRASRMNAALLTHFELLISRIALNLFP